MADNGQSKKLEQARAELEELRRRVDELEARIEASDGDAEREADETRRRLVHGAWMAPVIMAVNVPDSVFAQSMVSPSPDPSPKPTAKPSQKPTAKPSAKPTESDVRLKRDIERIATLDNGIRLYSYKYIWSEMSFVGVMAQDLLADTDRRGAVSTMASGYYGVDYEQLGLRLATLRDWREHGFEAVRSQNRRDVAAI